MQYREEQSGPFLWGSEEEEPMSAGSWSGYTVKKCLPYFSSPPALWAWHDLGKVCAGREMAADAAGKEM